MTEPILTEFWRVDDRAFRRPSAQMRWAREMAIKFLRREAPGDVPGRPPPSRLWTLQNMWSINTPVACTLISLVGFGVMFYIAIVIAGMSSYACPFQTPGSIALRGLWKKVRSGMVSCIVRSKRVLSWTYRMWGTVVKIKRPRHHL